MSSQDSHSISYRSDIDGLRALAILPVVLFHAFPNLLPGGFIGVDIFFVISGYLITSILLKDIQAGNYSIKTFYARRVRRIFPALSVVLVFCLALGWVVLTAVEYRALGKHAAGGAGFIANFMFWKEAGYFDAAGDTKPLLHLWSLGIEEQFYIV
jgi:peptidoglycan/LPS O-acetylase OafA/YrhL